MIACKSVRQREGPRNHANLARIKVVAILKSCSKILFDLDGVLVDSRLIVERTWRRWSERHGIHDTDLVRRAHGRTSRETVRSVAPNLDADTEVRWLAAAEQSDLEGLTVMPGASALLAALRSDEWAVVTSGGRDLASLRLEHSGLPQPGILVAAEDVATGKPSPEGYLLAVRRLGVDCSKCVVVEDTPPGIEAGFGAGAYVIALPTTFPAEALAKADVVVRSLAAIQIIHVNGRLERIIVDPIDQGVPPPPIDRRTLGAK